jgi:hypothetical protein
MAATENKSPHQGAAFLRPWVASGIPKSLAERPAAACFGLPKDFSILESHGGHLNNRSPVRRDRAILSDLPEDERHA